MNAIITKLDKQTHRNIMLNILLKIASDPLLSKNLVLKGGTALYFLHNLNRFSTDLDFDLVEIKLKNEILEKIGNIIKQYGEVKDLRIKRHTIFGLLSYGSIDHNVKIEINTRGVSGGYCFKNFLGIQLNIMNLEDMCANKLIALTNRTNLANRDIYDIHFILSNGFKINEKLILLKTGKNIHNYAKQCIIFLENLPTNHSILNGLGEILDKKQKEFCKNKLLNETIFLLHSLL